MSYIVNERWDRLKRGLSPTAWRHIKNKAAWEHITLSAAVLEYPSLVPKRLRKLAAGCFVETHREYLEARRVELRKTLSWIERELEG